MTLNKVKRVVLVLSGKGGVGKSSVAAELAMTLYHEGYSIGVLDIDLCGPSIPRIFNCTAAKVRQTEAGWLPVQATEDGRLVIMSIGFLLPSPDDAVVWRGPKKASMIGQFLHQVDWSSRDFLIIDTPPGTSDEHLAVVEQLGSFPDKSAVLVTTPQLVSLMDVEREVLFCQAVSLPIAGIIENMSGYACPHCHECTNIFSSSGGTALAAKYGLPFMGALPIVPALAEMFERDEASFAVVHAFSKCELFEKVRSIVQSFLLSPPTALSM